MSDKSVHEDGRSDLRVVTCSVGVPNFNECVRKRLAGASIQDTDVELQWYTALIFTEVLPDKIVIQVIGSLGDLRSCRASIRSRKTRKRGEANL